MKRLASFWRASSKARTRLAFILGAVAVAFTAFFASDANAQTKTIVSATVVDPNGVPYAGGSVATQLVPTSGTPTINKVPVNVQNNPAAIDANGHFTISLWCNTAGGACTPLDQTGTQWQFTITNPGAQPPVGFGGVSFTVSVTITGTTQDLSSTLSAAAVVLYRDSSSSGGVCPVGVTGTLQSTNGTNCVASHITDIAGTIAETGSVAITRAAPSIADTVGNASPITPGSVVQRVVTATPDTILNTDRQNRVAYNSTSAVAVTLPTAGSAGFAGGFNVRLSNQNTGVVTVTPATGTINGNATLVLQEGQDCFFTPSAAGTSWAADCNEPQTTAGAGISLTRGVHSLAISATGAISNANFVFDGDSRTAGAGSTSQCGASPCAINSNGFTAVTTGTATSGSTTLTVASGTNIGNGEQVFAVGVAPGTTVSSGGGTTTLTLSQATVAALSTTAVSFGNTDYPSQAMRLPSFSGHGAGVNLGISGNTCGQVAARYSTDAHTFSPAVTGKTGYFFLNCGTNSETAVTPTATGTNGQPTIVVSSATGIEIGDTVTGTGIGANAVVANTWNGTTTVTLTVNNSGTVSGTVTITPTAAIVAAAEAYVWALARADGYTVIATTNPMHVAQSSQRNLNDAYNNIVRGGFGYWQSFMDMQAKLVDTYDLSFYAADNTHFTNEGYAVWAQAASSAITQQVVDTFGMPLRRFANIGTNAGNYRGADTDLYSLTSGGDNTCAGLFCGTAITTGNFNTGFGFAPLPVLTTGSFNTAFGNGAGANIVTGANNTSIPGNPTGDFSGTTDIGANSASTGSFSVAVGYNTSAAASSMVLGVGASTTASGAVELDPVNSNTNSHANTLQYQNITIAGGSVFSVAGCGTATSLTGFSLTGQFTGGSATCTPVVTTGLTAPHGYSCRMNDQTTATALFRQTANTTTTATFTAGGVVGATDVINFSCDEF